jgi:hypothetical protein
MAWKEVTYRLTSSAPLLMHNGQTADPLNKWAKTLKQVTSKRVKTDADHEEMARIEFLASLYMGQDGPVLPPNMIDAMVVNAAKKSKEGPIAKSGCFCLNVTRLNYDGPRKADDLWADESFRFSAIVRVGTARVPRMRPIFQEWTADVRLNVEDGTVNLARVDEWMRIAGTQIGVGDWRPQYGRFTVERLTANGK